MGSIDMYCLDMGCRDEVQTTTAHWQAVHLHRSCPVCTSSLQPMSSLYPIFTAHVQGLLHLYSTNTDSTLFLQHLYCPYHYTISPSCLLTMLGHLTSIFNELFHILLIAYGMPYGNGLIAKVLVLLILWG